ncbi:unnamed protein product [Parnassius mnemosyne]|uniref:PiggyBac transposable element-derived protein domain-containing protein n=1 Tax=Parnassius mnemosyne TaxID=213953 RepID=A0AAV1L3R4_9NEOP
MQDEDILQVLGDGNDSDIECFDDSDDEEPFFDPAVLNNIGDLGLPEDPAENQRYDQVEGILVPDQSVPAPSSVVPTAKRPCRSGSRPSRWRVTSFEDKQHTYLERPMKSVRQPIDYVQDYFDDQFYEMVSTCTNLYYLRKTGSELKTTKSEIQKLFGIHILMRCIPFPRLPMY